MGNLKKYLREFLYEIEFIENSSINTVKSIENDVSQFIEFLLKDKNKTFNLEDNRNFKDNRDRENTDIQESLTQTEIKEFLFFLKQEGFSEKTLNRKISSLKKFVRYLRIKNILKDDILVHINSFKQEEKDIVRLTKQDILDLRNCYTINGLADYRDISIIELLYSSGITPKELLSLSELNLNLEKREVYISDKRKYRTQFFSERAKNYLNDYIDLKRDIFSSSYDNPNNKDILFINLSGTRLSDRSLRRIINNYRNKSKIDKDITPYSFRHTFCIEMLKKGMSKEYLKILLGIKSAESLEKYELILKKEYLWEMNV